jgi:hypothetical protein
MPLTPPDKTAFLRTQAFAYRAFVHTALGMIATAYCLLDTAQDGDTLGFISFALPLLTLSTFLVQAGSLWWATKKYMEKHDHEQ